MYLPVTTPRRWIYLFCRRCCAPNFRWLAKKELFGIPLFGPAMAGMGYIPLDRSDRRAAMKSVQPGCGPH